ncbi:hypothetical protein BLA29_015194, partial [Euroglyphus maynei]
MHHKVSSRTLTSKDGDRIRDLANRMVAIEELLKDRTEEEVKTSGNYHQKIGEILTALDKLREKSVAKMD